MSDWKERHWDNANLLGRIHIVLFWPCAIVFYLSAFYGGLKLTKFLLDKV